VLRATDPARARALAEGAGLRDVRADDGVIHFQADEQAVAALTVALGRAEIGVTALVPQRASLEELFLDLTGEEAAP
jgi:hypothetical protein